MRIWNPPQLECPKRQQQTYRDALQALKLFPKCERSIQDWHSPIHKLYDRLGWTDIEKQFYITPILRTSARSVSDQILIPASRDTLTPWSPTSGKYALSQGQQYQREISLTPNSRTAMEDVSISQVPANDTPGTKAFVDAHISKPSLKPQDPNA